MSHAGSSSPDPIVLASSPLAPHSARRPSVKPPFVRSPTKHMYSSPSKSFVLETGQADGASPWRIKVTVQAEPTAESPSRKVRGKSVQVPLKGLESSSSSPAKRRVRGTDESGAEVKRPLRKRKGTPIRRKREVPSPPEPSRMTSSVGAGGGAGDDAAPPMPPPAPPSCSRKSSAERERERERARRRRSFQTLPKQRGNRLSQAREELDHALNDALGYEGYDVDGDGGGDEGGDEAAGDMTMMNEDFTMVSVQTLQSMRGDTSMLSHRNEGDRSALSLSYVPSSPPKQPSPEKAVTCPDSSPEVRRASEHHVRHSPHVDVMSWQPTGRARDEARWRREQRVAEMTRETQTRAWQVERDEVSRLIKKASPGEVVLGDDEDSLSEDEPGEDAVLGAEVAAGVAEEDVEGEVVEEEAEVLVEEEAEEAAKEAEEEAGAKTEDRHAEDDDIWQEEASRSLEDDNEQHQTRSRRQRRHEEADKPAQHDQPESLGNLFATGPVKPPRAKIPRTWRRTSGIDFQYSDSPAHVEPVDVPKKREHSTGGESRASSGVLTPPSSGDEAQKGDQEDGRDITSFTRPDAAATQIDQDPDRDEVLSTSEEDTSPDGDDTGLFWQSNMPQVYRRPPQRPRPQRQPAMDLSELLGLGKDSSPARPASGEALTGAKARPSGSPNSKPPRTRPGDARVKANPSGAKLINSPLRKSLLKSSKLHGGSPVASSSRSGHVSRHDSSFQSGEQSTTGMESFASKESDQRQLLSEMAVEQMASQKRTSALQQRYEPSSEHISEDEDDSGSHDHDMQEYEEEEDAGSEGSFEQDEPQYSEPSHSYRYSDHTPHEPSRSYEERLNLDSPTKIKVNFNDSSLLQPQRPTKPPFTNSPPHSPPTITLVARKDPQPTLLSRLTTTFWSAVIRPTGPTYLPPAPITPDPIFPPSLRAHIRSRYGVLPSTHPWTMQHMRTLHRMLNSTTSNKIDSIIPTPGSAPLPHHLRDAIGHPQTSITGHRYLFTAQLAHVVDCLMQVLVPRSVVDAMVNGEIEALGDEVAASYRGELGDGRWGGDLVWRPPVVQPRRGEVRWEWVVRCLGDVLVGKEGCEERRRRAAVKSGG